MKKFRDVLRKKMTLPEELSYWQQDIRKSEYGIALGRGLAVLLVISYLFYNSVIITILFLPLLAIYMRWWKIQISQEKRREFQLQFKDAMQSFSMALRAGYSMENAVKETKKDLTGQYQETDRIMEELTFMIRQLHMNLPVEQTFVELASRTRQEDVVSFSSVYSIARRQGGDLILIMNRSVENICERVDVRRDIITLMRAKQFEFQIMSLIPFGMIGYMRLSFPEFMSVLYGNMVGILLMSGCLILYTFAYLMGRKFTEIEV